MVGGESAYGAAGVDRRQKTIVCRTDCEPPVYWNCATQAAGVDRRQKTIVCRTDCEPPVTGSARPKPLASTDDRRRSSVAQTASRRLTGSARPSLDRRRKTIVCRTDCEPPVIGKSGLYCPNATLFA